MEYKHKSGAMKRKEKREKEEKGKKGQTSLLSLGFVSTSMCSDRDNEETQSPGVQATEVENGKDKSVT